MQVNIKTPDNRKIKQDPIIKQLSNATHAEINEWVDDNVTDIEDVKQVLKRLLKLTIPKG